MKKSLMALLFGTTLILGACGGGGGSADDGPVNSELAHDVARQVVAQAGDTSIGSSTRSDVEQVVQVEPLEAWPLLAPHRAEVELAHERRVENDTRDERRNEQRPHRCEQQHTRQAEEHVGVELKQELDQRVAGDVHVADRVENLADHLQHAVLRLQERDRIADVGRCRTGTAGRGRQLAASAVKQFASPRSLPIEQPSSLTDPRALEVRAPDQHGDGRGRPDSGQHADQRAEQHAEREHAER